MAVRCVADPGVVYFGRPLRAALFAGGPSISLPWAGSDGTNSSNASGIQAAAEEWLCEGQPFFAVWDDATDTFPVSAPRPSPPRCLLTHATLSLSRARALSLSHKTHTHTTHRNTHTCVCIYAHLRFMPRTHDVLPPLAESQQECMSCSLPVASASVLLLLLALLQVCPRTCEKSGSYWA